MFQQSNHLHRGGRRLRPQSITWHSPYHVQSHPNGYPMKSMGGSSYLISTVWVADSNITHDLEGIYGILTILLYQNKGNYPVLTSLPPVSGHLPCTWTLKYGPSHIQTLHFMCKPCIFSLQNRCYRYFFSFFRQAKT